MAEDEEKTPPGDPKTSADAGKKAPFDADKVRVNFDRWMRSTVEGLEDLREVLVRASQDAKTKLDATLLRRERDRLYQLLGEQAYLQIEAGSLKAPAAMRDTLDRVHAIIEQLVAEDAASDRSESSEQEAETEEE